MAGNMVGNIMRKMIGQKRKEEERKERERGKDFKNKNQ